MRGRANEYSPIIYGTEHRVGFFGANIDTFHMVLVSPMCDNQLQHPQRISTGRANTLGLLHRLIDIYCVVSLDNQLYCFFCRLVNFIQYPKSHRSTHFAIAPKYKVKKQRWCSAYGFDFFFKGLLSVMSQLVAKYFWEWYLQITMFPTYSQFDWYLICSGSCLGLISQISLRYNLVENAMKM